MNALHTLRPGGLLTLLSRLARPARPRPLRAIAPQPLERAATRWVPHPRGWIVGCEAGTLWLTFDGDARDIVLEAGQTHRCECDRRLAIHALDAALLHLRPAASRR